MYNGFNGDTAAAADARRSVWLCLKTAMDPQIELLSQLCSPIEKYKRLSNYQLKLSVHIYTS